MLMFVWNRVDVLTVHDYKDNISAALLWWITNKYAQCLGVICLGVKMAAATNVC